MPKIIIYLLLVIVIFIGIILVYININKTKTITINNKYYKVEVVTDLLSKTKGLSNREKLTNIDGMLFVYSAPEIQNFWMKDMRFDLDLIWINNNKIIGLTKNISFKDQFRQYSSALPCDWVLEVPSGKVDQEHWQIGDTITLK